MNKNPQPTTRIVNRLRRQARKLQNLAPRQSRTGVPVEMLLLRAMANVNWQAAGRLEEALPLVRALASCDCADGKVAYPGIAAQCGQCGPCLAKQFLTTTGDAKDVKRESD